MNKLLQEKNSGYLNAFLLFVSRAYCESTPEGTKSYDILTGYFSPFAPVSLELIRSEKPWAS